METTIFEHIKAKCQQKKITSLCNKLSKKCSFQSGATCENLCHLTYWLYIYGRNELALDCIALTRHVPFNGNYSVWTFIHAMWGLELRLLREQGKYDEATRIVEAINTHFLTPNKLETPEAMSANEEKRRSRFNYKDTIQQENIESYLAENNISSANAWRFIALLQMIGLTETGFYPQLNQHKVQIEQKTTAYMSELAKIK